MDNLKEFLLQTDTRLFKFINVTLHNEPFAEIIKFAANDVFLAAFVFGGAAFLIKKNTLRKRINIAFALWAIIITHIINSDILKNIFKRPRPPQELENIYFLVNMRCMNYAFPSTHTAMAAALAAVLWQDNKNLRPYLALFTAGIGFFCVYTGGHYPFDVLAGLVVGIFSGCILNIIKNKAKKHYGAKNE